MLSFPDFTLLRFTIRVYIINLFLFLSAFLLTCLKVMYFMFPSLLALALVCLCNHLSYLFPTVTNSVFAVLIHPYPLSVCTLSLVVFFRVFPTKPALQVILLIVSLSCLLLGVTPIPYSMCYPYLPCPNLFLIPYFCFPSLLRLPSRVLIFLEGGICTSLMSLSSPTCRLFYSMYKFGTL